MKLQSSGCTARSKAKYSKSNNGSLTIATTVRHLHADVKGMTKNRSGGDTSYFVVILDENSRFVRATSIGKKSKVSDGILAFVWWIERQSGQAMQSY